MKPIINPTSEVLINKLANNLPQSLLLCGERGVGLCSIAKYISELNNVCPLMILPEKDEIIDTEKGFIGVDNIRQLIEQTKTKTDKMRIFIIDYAEKMTLGAQNAFLKLLEEPNENTHLILLCDNTLSLLPTILSRTEKMNVRPITKGQSISLLDSLGEKDKLKRTQLMFIACGKPAELTRLCRDTSYFESRSAIVRDARELLSGSIYQKLLLAQKYKDNRIFSLLLLNDACNILRKTIIDNSQENSLRLIDKIINTYKQIEQNGNIRLNLARLVL